MAKLWYRCPKCRWHLEFVPYYIAYDGYKLGLWEARCWNPNCQVNVVKAPTSDEEEPQDMEDVIRNWGRR